MDHARPQRRATTPDNGVANARDIAAGLGPTADRGNEAKIERMGGQRSALSQRMGLLDHASGSFGDLEGGDAESLTGLNERLAATREMLADGDMATLQKEIAALDSEFGGLVSSTGTIIDMKGLGPSDAPEGAFDNVDSYYVNGMTNSLTQSMTSAQELAEIRGTDVGLVYNNTEGTRKDLGQSLGQKARAALPFLESRTTEGATLANAVDGSLDAGRNVDIVSHSQGGYFGQEALERLGNTDEDKQRLDERVHMNLLGSAVEDDNLPKFWNNATFIDENSDPISDIAGDRDATPDSERSWWEKISPFSGDNTMRGGMKQMEFESGEVGWASHRPSTYLQNEEVRDQLATNPFAAEHGP